mmetsp:Transcript_14156/g.29975  ORF Transcript_14156/g.29975 Transcript_14156/m.29975 type:complete len:208 (-) Transcript_14156:132-755(-)
MGLGNPQTNTVVVKNFVNSPGQKSQREFFLYLFFLVFGIIIHYFFFVVGISKGHALFLVRFLDIISIIVLVIARYFSQRDFPVDRHKDRSGLPLNVQSVSVLFIKIHSTPLGGLQDCIFAKFSVSLRQSLKQSRTTTRCSGNVSISIGIDSIGVSAVGSKGVDHRRKLCLQQKGKYRRYKDCHFANKSRSPYCCHSCCYCCDSFTNG